jgi:hypothetical protein
MTSDPTRCRGCDVWTDAVSTHAGLDGAIGRTVAIDLRAELDLWQLTAYARSTSHREARVTRSWDSVPYDTVG